MDSRNQFVDTNPTCIWCPATVERVYEMFKVYFNGDSAMANESY